MFGGIKLLVLYVPLKSATRGLPLFYKEFVKNGKLKIVKSEHMFGGIKLLVLYYLAM